MRPRSWCAPRTTRATCPSPAASRTGASSRTSSGTTAPRGIWQPVWLEAVPDVGRRLDALDPDLPGGDGAARLAPDRRPATGTDACASRSRTTGRSTLAEAVDRCRRPTTSPSCWRCPRRPTGRPTKSCCGRPSTRAWSMRASGRRRRRRRRRRLLPRPPHGGRRARALPAQRPARTTCGRAQPGLLAASRTSPRRRPTPCAPRRSSSRTSASTRPACTRSSRTRASCTGPTGSGCWSGARRPASFTFSPARGRAHGARVARDRATATSRTVASSRGCRSTRAGACSTSRTTPRMQHYARSLVELTKALDPTRPVVSNDGWEQVDTDIVAIHDYEWSAEVLRARYRDQDALNADARWHRPGRPTACCSTGRGGRPARDAHRVRRHLVSTSKAVPMTHGATRAATSSEDFVERLAASSTPCTPARSLAGFCYTQLVDTLQETNGLLADDRTPKAPLETLRAVITRTGPAGH